MTATEVKNKIINKYEVGQEVNLRFRDTKEKIIERKKAKVLRFYPHMILCEVDRNKECFTYNDLNSLTAYSTTKKG